MSHKWDNDYQAHMDAAKAVKLAMDRVTNCGAAVQRAQHDLDEAEGDLREARRRYLETLADVRAHLKMEDDDE